MRSRLPFVLLVAVLALPAAAEAANGRTHPKITVMTRNVYLGGDISLPVGSRTREEFAQKNQIVYDTVKKTRFPARAKLLALEVKRTNPDLIGLQEVAKWMTGPRDDPAPARDVSYDFLKSLRRALAARGLRYRVGSVQQEAVVEGPTVSDGDVRLVMRDVILVKRRKGLRVLRRGGANFKARVSVETAAGPVTVKRGYTFVDASVSGRKLRFIDTHLESFLEGPRVAQSKELIGRRGPTRTRLPKILVGDLNSDPNGDPDGRGNPAAYRNIIGAGFKDAWTRINRRQKGYACCLTRPDLSDPPPFPADHRIDHVLFKGRFRGLRASRVGLDPKNRTKSGLWPSDHGGVVATLRLR